MNYELAAALGIETEPTEFYNLQTIQRHLNKLKLVSNETASKLINDARATLDKALAIANKSGHDAVIKQVQKDSDRIREQLLAFSVEGDPKANFPNVSALKNLYSQAFVTYNAALQGKRDAESISYFKEVISTLADLAEKSQRAASTGFSVFKILAGAAAIVGGGILIYNFTRPKRRYDEDRRY